ncbi:hypothetical protein [Winslowiella iniecta]|uniref:Uncharacterized protein n=1 Tax=Winslowiella iniecta TaxID=1560201 RepID=A0A0L7SVW5_9GAMM|nr:hypothetical protein [Winslowiella iniecta]KOC86672.1 hypothetical protein NG42_21560 [Winslowiella iniecta]KOC87287.1 hypothetical protein NG43_21530 [Winslowiella iniecta]
MQRENEEITISGKELVEVLTVVNFSLISMRNIARYYYDSEVNREGYEKEIASFIDHNQLVEQLANVRKILSKNFNNDIGDDDMGDLEREMEKIKYWEKPGD